MSEEKKTGEEKSKEEINITSSVDQSDEASRNNKTYGELEVEKDKSKKIKNLMALAILLAGIAIGSIFVDVVQFITGSGYSVRALKDAQIFESGGKTWVAFSDPRTEVIALGVSEAEKKSCPQCDPTQILQAIKRVLPTMQAKMVDSESVEGKALIEKYKIKTIPAFLFDEKIKDTSFYQTEGKTLFDQKEEKFVLNTAGLGVPIGKYLETPKISESDAVLGNKDAKVKIIIFSDFQCPYCKSFFVSMFKVAKSYGDKVALVYKEFPLESIHPQARNASLAAQCAQEQGKFWEMAELLYGNQEVWGAQGLTENVSKNIFKGYALRLRLNTNNFNTCLDSAKYDDKVSSDAAEGEKFGISGTPSGFINQQFLGGVAKEDALKKMIDDELAK